MATIVTSEKCLNCRHCTILEKSKAGVYIACAFRDKEYFYGKIIECSDFEKRRESND